MKNLLGLVNRGSLRLRTLASAADLAVEQVVIPAIRSVVGNVQGVMRANRPTVLVIVKPVAVVAANSHFAALSKAFSLAQLSTVQTGMGL